MSVVIIDLNETRRRLLLESACAAAQSGGQDTAVAAVRAFSKANLDGSPTLVIWHVSDRQNGLENGRLGEQVSNIAGRQTIWIAGFTAGDIATELEEQLPGESDHFRLSRHSDEPAKLAETVRALVTQWISGGYSFAQGALQVSWLGVDPLLEAKLEFLTVRLTAEDGVDVSDEALRLLEGAYKNSKFDKTSVPPGNSQTLTAIRDLFFGR